MAKKQPESHFKNRIVGTGEMAPADIKANPLNWRTHPFHQKNALAGVLEEVGWVQTVIVNKRTNCLIDGHLRVELAKNRKEPTVPVSFVDLDEAEEALILATFDPIAAMAEADAAMLAEILTRFQTENEGINSMIADLLAKEPIMAETSGGVPLVEQFVIPPFSVLDTVAAFEDAGACYYNEAILVNSAASAAIRAPRLFKSTRKLTRIHQNVLVFIKGDVRKAVEAIGDIVCGEVDSELFCH